MIFVTGASGYIGRVLTSRLREAGIPFRGIDTNWFAGACLAPTTTGELIQLDIRDVTSSQLSGCTHIVHLAAVSNDVMGEISEAATWEINRDATVQLALLAKSAGVSSFLFFSTCSVYGIVDGAALLDETSETRPLSAYARSKLAAEHELLKLSDDRFEVVILRNGTAFGPSTCPRLDLVLNDFVDHALRDGEILLKSDGGAARPLVDVRDIATVALNLLRFSCPIPHRVINVGHESGNTIIRDLAKLVGNFLQVPIKYVSGAQRDNRDYRVDFSLLRSLFPQLRFIRLADGISDMRDFWRMYELGNRRREDFVRLAVLRDLRTAQKLNDMLRWN